MSIPDLLPDPEILLALAPEELASKILQSFQGGSKTLRTPASTVSQIWSALGTGEGKYARHHRPEVEIAIHEAFAWLQSNGLLMPEPGPNGDNGYLILTRLGQKVQSERDFADYAVSQLLPRKLLHRAIPESTWLAFIRGDYTTAVFEAMREVEIAVRDAAGYKSGDYGVPMVRNAFKKESGPLTDTLAEISEQEALASLFAGAIGSYKNPHSHRHVDLDDPMEVAEIVMLASHLLRIVEARSEEKI